MENLKLKIVIFRFVLDLQESCRRVGQYSSEGESDVGDEITARNDSG